MASGGKEYFDPQNTPNDYIQLDAIIKNHSLWGKAFPKHNKNKTMTEMAMRSLFTHRIQKNEDLNKFFK